MFLFFYQGDVRLPWKVHCDIDSLRIHLKPHWCRQECVSLLTLSSRLFSVLCKIVDFFLIWALIVVCNRAGGCGAVLILHNSVPLIPGSAVMGVQCEKAGAEHRALGDSSVGHWSRGGVIANLNCLGSACEEVQYPVAECGTETQSVNFLYQLHGWNYTEAWAEVNKQIWLWPFLRSMVCEDQVEGSGYDILCGSVGSECILVRVQGPDGWRCYLWHAGEPTSLSLLTYQL